MTNKVDFFVLLLSVFVSLFVEDKVSNFVNYHWSLGVFITIPIVVVLMVIYNTVKKEKNVD